MKPLAVSELYASKLSDSDDYSPPLSCKLCSHSVVRLDNVLNWLFGIDANVFDDKSLREAKSTIITAIYLYQQ